MPTPLRRIFIEPLDARSHLFVDKATGEQPKPGDVFYAPHLFSEDMIEPRARFAPQYLADRADTGRPPIVVVLPNGKWWSLDERSYTPEKGYHGDGWYVTGSIDNDPITLTVRPSVRAGDYHGMLSDGVLSDSMDAGPRGEPDTA